MLASCDTLAGAHSPWDNDPCPLTAAVFEQSYRACFEPLKTILDLRQTAIQVLVDLYKAAACRRMNGIFSQMLDCDGLIHIY